MRNISNAPQKFFMHEITMQVQFTVNLTQQKPNYLN